MVSGLLNQLQHVLTIVFDKIARAFVGSGANWTVVIDTSKAFAGVYCAGLPHKHNSNRISGKIFGLTSSFLNNKWLQVVPDGMFFQEYPVHAGVLSGSILGPTLFLLYINDLPGDVICNVSVMASWTFISVMFFLSSVIP